MFFHWSYLLLIPGLLLTFWASNNIKGTYRRYAQIPSSLGLTGAQVAQTILSKMGIQGVKVESIAGELTDHYDPSTKTVRLSQGIYNSRSLAAAAVAAHECGHVLQDEQGYALMNLRAALVPAANLGGKVSPLLIMAGLVLGQLGQPFIFIGIGLFLGVIAFHLVTLPVELDASHRALQLIDQLGILQGEENLGARAVLRAAALTYVATALYGLLQLAQYLILLSSRNRY